jgi:UPF0755 protein
VSERSPAEREAARLERERRRAQRLDAGQSDESGADFGQSHGGDGADEAQEDSGAERTNGRNGGTQEFVLAGSSGLGTDSRHEPGEWFDDNDGELEVEDRREGHDALQAAEDHEPRGGYEREDDFEDDEPPAGTRRVANSERLGGAAAVSRPKRRREPRRRRRTGPVQRRRPAPPGSTEKKHSLAGRLFSVLAIVAAGALIWFLVELFQPFHSSGHQRVTAVIPANSSVGTIGKLLERDGVVSSSFFFELRATLAGERSDLRSGTYHLRQGMGYGDVLKVLTTAPPAVKVTNLTIVEGKTRHQVDTLLHSQGVHGSYLALTRRSHLLDPRHYGAPRGTNSLEGFLFPSTYQLREPITASALVTDQLKAFRQRFGKVNLGYARSKRLTGYDLLTVASMIQAEAETAHDRPLIASVIYNRLALGMPLQIDATTRYATGNYAKPLTVSQLNSSSPYNTRIHQGLPPTPINSPGMASIQAAAHPAHTNYLYFVVKPCGNGEHAFAATYSKFQAEVAQYQTARTSRRGRSPEHC